MTNAIHTPGPWTYEGDHTHRQFNIRMLGHLIGTKDEAKHICTVNNLPTHVLANRDPATAEANARLIAAAPELLEALKRAAFALESAVMLQGLAELAPYANAARAAIAKAKGE